MCNGPKFGDEVWAVEAWLESMMEPIRVLYVIGFVAIVKSKALRATRGGPALASASAH